MELHEASLKGTTQPTWLFESSFVTDSIQLEILLNMNRLKIIIEKAFTFENYFENLI